MSEAGQGDVVVAAVAAAPIVVAGMAVGGLLYLAFKGISLAVMGAKKGCQEIQRKRQEALQRAERDRQLLEKLRAMTKSHEPAQLFKADRLLDQMHRERKAAEEQERNLLEEWKAGREKAMKAQFESLARMGVDQERVARAEEGFLSSLKTVAPPEPRAETTVDLEAVRMESRANALKDRLDRMTMDNHQDRAYFDKALKDRHFAEAVSEGYRLIALKGTAQACVTDIAMLRMELLTETYLPENLVNSQMGHLLEAEQALVADKIDKARETVAEVRARIEQFTGSLKDLDGYKSQAESARKMIHELEEMRAEGITQDQDRRQKTLETLRQAFRDGAYDRVLTEGKDLSAQWLKEEEGLVDEACRGIAEEVPNQVQEVLEDLGYVVDRKGGALKGKKEGRIFEVWYEDGQLQYDLSHEGFPSQKACDRELAEFMLRLAERGILVETTPKPTHPEGNRLEQLADEISRALEEIGVDWRDIVREDEGSVIRLIVQSEPDMGPLELRHEDEILIGNERFTSTDDALEDIRMRDRDKGRVGGWIRE